MITLTITCGIAVLISSILLFNREQDNSMRKKVDVAQSIIEVEIDELLNKALLTASAMRVHQNLSEALAGNDFERVSVIANSLRNMAHLDFCTIVDRDGNVIIRVHDPDNRGDSLMGLSHVQSAFDNRVESYIVPGVTIRLGVMAGAPIYDLNENIVGAISLGFRLDSQAFVERLGQLTECEISMYLYDELVASTFLNEGDAHTPGRTADESISETVLAGEAFEGRVNFSGKTLLSSYFPLFGINNEVVGMVFVGYDTAAAFQDVLIFTVIGLVITFIVLAICIVLARRISNAMEERMNRAHNHTTRFVESNPHINILFDSNFNVIDCNPASLSFFGFKEKSEMISGFVERLRSSIPERQSDGRPTIPLIEGFMAAVKEGFIKIDSEIKLGGKVKSLSVELKRIPYDDNFAIIAYVQDMTEIRDREAELVRINDINELHLVKLNTVIKAANIALWDGEPVDGEPVGPDTSVAWSDEFRSILGYSDDNDFPNVLGSWIDRLHPDDKERTLNAFASHLYDTTGKTPFNVEYRLLKKNGEYSYYHAAGESIRDADGNAIRVAGALMDITETKNLQFNLEHERSTLQLMFDSSPDHIFCKDMDFKYTRCNETLLRYHGLKKENLIGEDDESGLGVEHSIAMEYRAADIAVINDNISFVYEENVPDLDGRIRLFETNKVPLVLNGKAVGVMGVARDITERKAMEEAAQSANRSKTVFLANMSHEIRTPMNSIIGFSELAQNDDISEKTRAYLGNIQDSAEWLLKIINDILDISKIESGKIELENIPFDLPDIFAHCQSAIMPKIAEKGIMLYCYAEPSIGKKLLGDPVRLRQIIMNLLSNAVKFTNSGTVKFLASVSASDENSVTIMFEIKDSGIGMSVEQIDRVFKPFTQAEDSITRRFGGTGLGLTITQNIIGLMGGTLSVESTPGVGSKFCFELKFNLIDEEDIPNESFILNDFEKPIFKGEVLVFEDNSLNQQVICDHLDRVGLQTIAAHNGKEGIDIITKRMKDKKKPFDLIFMDIHMPVMDGLDAAQKITAMGINTPIIALTANIMSNDLELYKASGMCDTVGKPFTTNDLWRCLAKYIPVESYTTIDRRRMAIEDSNALKMIKTNFVKNNQTIYDDIISAANSGDIKLAHRLAHTLKSNAGQIERKSLHSAAAKVEASLKSEKALPGEEAMKVFKAEILSALDDLAPLMDEHKSRNTPDAFDAKKAFELLDELEPLIQNNNTKSLKLVDRLYSIPGSEDLITQIEGFKFWEALASLKKLRKDMETADEKNE